MAYKLFTCFPPAFLLLDLSRNQALKPELPGQNLNCWRCLLYQIRLGKYIIVKARQEAGGRRQEKNNYGIKTGFSIISHLPRK